MSQVVGRYELLRPLARGGMAEVFHARRRGPGGVEKRLVVKRIRRERSADPRFVQLFVQEARLSMSLAHKNIVPVFDFGRVGDELFLVMEYVDGPDLAAAVERGREADAPIDAELAAFIAMEACQALDYAHRARNEAGAPRAIVHRDVTTRNVLVSSSGEVKLVDFGVATSETDLGARKVRGTPAYMSPEQARGDTVDPRSDVFSLGLVLYELVSGERAYGATSNSELLEQARRAAVPALPGSVADELRGIVARATAAAADDRFEDARAMQLALDSFLVKARARSGGPPPSVRLAAWIERIWTDRERAGPTPHGADADAGADGDGDGEPPFPVVTFLDDGEQALASLAAGEETLQSMAATLGESVAVSAGGAGASAGNEGRDDDLSRGAAGGGGASDGDQASPGDPAPPAPAQQRRSAWFPWSVAAVVVALAVLGIVAVVDSDVGQPDVVRPGRASATSATSATSAGSETAGAGAASDGLTANADDGENADNDGPDSSKTSAEAETAGTGDAPEASGKALPAPGAEARGRGPGASRSPGEPNAPPGRDTASEPTGATGTAAIAVRPWARVTVAGRSDNCPETPCRIELPAGRHTLVLEHTVWNVTKTVDVEIRADQVTQVSEVLLQPR